MATKQRTVVGPELPMARGSTDDAIPAAEVSGREAAGRPAPVIGRVVRDAPAPGAWRLGRVVREAAGPGVRSFGCVVRQAPERSARVLGRVTLEGTAAARAGSVRAEA